MSTAAVADEGFPISDNTLLETLKLNAGPLALGLGAIIAVGAISGGSKTAVSTPNVK